MKLSYGDNGFIFRESGKPELLSGRAEEHRHHTNNKEGKALPTAETRAGERQGVKHRGVAGGSWGANRARAQTVAAPERESLPGFRSMRD